MWRWCRSLNDFSSVVVGSVEGEGEGGREEGVERGGREGREGTEVQKS